MRPITAPLRFHLLDAESWKQIASRTKIKVIEGQPNKRSIRNKVIHFNSKHPRGLCPVGQTNELLGRLALGHDWMTSFFTSLNTWPLAVFLIKYAFNRSPCFNVYSTLVVFKSFGRTLSAADKKNWSRKTRKHKLNTHLSSGTETGLSLTA